MKFSNGVLKVVIELYHPRSILVEKQIFQFFPEVTQSWKCFSLSFLCNYYRPQTKFLQVSVCPQGDVRGRGGVCGRWTCMAGGMHGRGVYMARGMHGWGHVWQGDKCGGGGACVAGGGACVVGGHAWQGASMAGHAHLRYYKIWSMSRQYASYWNAFLSLHINSFNT